MVDRDSVVARLQKLEDCLRILGELRTEARERFLTDFRVHGLAERYLQVAAECLCDLGSHVLAESGISPPATYKEVFRKLAEHCQLSSELASELETWAGLRNVLVHLYLTVDHGRLYEILQDELDTPRRFIQYVSGML